MGNGEKTEVGLDEETLSRLRRCLSRHPVSFAMVFGSAARDEATAESDIDLAVAFDSYRPDDDGYSDVYLRLRSDLDDALAADIDVVDVYSMSPAFAQTAFDSGVVVLGSKEQRVELERKLGGEQPSVTEARKRVAAAADRLRKTDDADARELSE